MKTLKFETNINCGGCKSKVAPFLDGAEGVCHWDVDLTDSKKILSVQSEGITEEEVAELVAKVGFKAEPID